ncbi:endonuclease VII domain-containing protein [Blastococcus sp. SYSU D00669]
MTAGEPTSGDDAGDEEGESPRRRPGKVAMDPLVHACDGSQPKNRCECYRAWMREYQRRRRANNAHAVQDNRRANLRRLYGVTPEEVDALRVAQNYRCAICGRHEDEVERPATGRPRRDGTRTPSPGLVVDHCHRTSRIRALLCNHCNAGLGYFGEDATRLRAAAAWLEANNPPQRTSTDPR